MKDGFIKTEAISPALKVADCAYNTAQIIDALCEAAECNTQLAVFPELCITSYTCGDLFMQDTLLNAAKKSLYEIAYASIGLNIVSVVGLPLEVNNKLYNCAAVISDGEVLGIVPKTYMPNYAEFYELRWFTPAPSDTCEINIEGFEYPISFGTDIIFRCNQLKGFSLAVEICEDLWAPVPPSCYHAQAGAVIIVNPSASDETIGKAEYRRSLVTGQSARLLGAYVYVSAGHGESTTDMSFSAHNIICENGRILAESNPFGTGFAGADIDVASLLSERMKNTTFQSDAEGYTDVFFNLNIIENELDREYSKTPFVPEDAERRSERCELILNIQADGLAKRLEHTKADTAVIGISGGLDSCLALLVCVRAMKQLNRSSSDILAVTMPCFGTSKRTRTNAEILCRQLGVTFKEIRISEAVGIHFRDIGQDINNTDVTFENGQARMRTLVLMDMANRTGGMVIGTGDLSELALGWATYNGDHMSMYAVNAGVPKTLVRHIVAYEADLAKASGRYTLSECLENILDTPVSPELLPPGDRDEISQKTESIIGPYELHDFYLYYVLRFGFGPKKIYRIARRTFSDKYNEKELIYWLRNFYRRFFAQQFKRSCMPDGPKVGSVTLSPRGDWRMPSDAVCSVWMTEIEELESD